MKVTDLAGQEPRQHVVPVLLVAAAAAGLICAMISSAQPWTATDYELSRPVLIMMACGGAGVLGLTARRVRRLPRLGAVEVGVTVLGLVVTIYPSLLAWAGRGAGPAVDTLASGWHVTALTLVQLLPVLAVARVTGRSRGRWSAAIITVALAGVAATGLVLTGVVGSPALLVVSLVLWFGSFVLSPLGTWSTIRATAGDVRRRAVVAGLASLVPIVIIVWCVVLGATVDAVGMDEDASITVLMIGFTLGTLASALLTFGATGAAESPALTTPTVVGALNALLAAVTLLVAGGVALLATTAALPPGWGVLVGVATAVTLGLPWLRWHAWAARVVDPSSELRHELTAAGALVDDHHRAAEQVLRRIVADPALSMIIAGRGGSWIDVEGDPPPTDPTGSRGSELDVVLARAEDGSAAVVGRASSPAFAHRLRRLGDCTASLGPAVWQAQVADATRRADRSAADERRRLSQNLHDGLQGRLLGLALNLQLSGRRLDDPQARLVVEQTVDTLRAAVDDVRALGGGRLPDLLVDQGLHAALAELFRPLGAVVGLDVPGGRLSPAVEATAYFVVGEAVTNALKHARPGRVDVQVTSSEATRVVVTVTDDGIGGADPRLGSGLRGLAERVSADGGVFLVRDGAVRGTVVEAVLPCES